MRGKALKNYGTVAALVIIIGIFGLLRPASFFTLKNFLNITRQAAPLAMVALGATFVMTVNEFDLSIGNIVSLGGVVAALLSIQGVPIPVCFLAAVVAGLIVGCVNGVIVAKFGAVHGGGRLLLQDTVGRSKNRVRLCRGFGSCRI